MKKKRENSDGLTLLMIFLIITLMIIAISWLGRDKEKLDRYDASGSSVAQEKKDNYQGIIIIATATTVTVLAAVIGKKIVDKHKKKIRAKELERRELASKEKTEQQADIEKILAIGQKTINSRNYHKNYGRQRDMGDIPERVSMKLGDMDDFDYVEDDEKYARKEKKNNIVFYIILGGIGCIGIGFIIAVLVL